MNTFTITSLLTRGAAFGALAALICIGANGAEPDSSEKTKHSPGMVLHQRTVRYSDLDLTVQSDVVRLYRRIERAAAAVCGGRMQPLALRSPRYGSCRGKAVADAIHRVNKPTLTAYYNSKRGDSQLASKAYASANER